MPTLTFENKEQNRLLKRFHTLLGKAGISRAGKEGLLAGYGVESSKDLTIAQLVECCDILYGKLNPNLQELDKARKQLMASISEWHRATNRNNPSADYIKEIASRASKVVEFNKIPLKQLRRLIGLFNKARREHLRVTELTLDMINHLSLNN